MPHTSTIDDPAARSLIVRNGLVIPWVTKWTGESALNNAIRVTTAGAAIRVHYAQPTPFDRDARGILWFRDGTGRHGEPILSTVHTARQRRCMTTPRCQVCGVRLPAARTPWLLGRAEWDDLTGDGDPVTGTPPTCERCWPIAERLCPHLAHGGAVRAYAARIEPWGAIGDVYGSDGLPRPGVAVPLADTRGLPRLLAKQLLVRVHGLTRAAAPRAARRERPDLNHT